jgi:guanylate cyclase
LADLLWKAPELLRGVNPTVKATQKGDMYSFAIILYEIIGRKGPYGPGHEDPKGIMIIKISFILNVMKS